MKRFWHTWLAVVASAAMVNTASAQNDWNQSSEIGSYQSILARAGYSNDQALPSQNSVAMPAGQMMPGNSPVMNGQIINAPAGQGCSGACGGQCDGGCGGSYGNGDVDYNNGGGRLAGRLAGRRAGGYSDCSSGNCGGEYAGDGYVDGSSCGDGGYVDSGYAGEHDGGVYGRTSSIGNRLKGLGNGASDSGVNYVVGARALFMRRNHEDEVQLTRNGAGGFMGSNSSRMQTMGGVEFGITRRNCNGNGIQFSYWGLYPGDQTYSLAGPGLNTYQTTLASMNVQGFGTNLQDYFNNSDSNEAFRRNVFHNAEANLLRNGGTYTTRSGKTGNYEMLGGFRWFQFNEEFRYSALYAASNPSQVNYDIDVDNLLLGAQLGGRNEVCLTDRLSLATALKLGLFNNHITHTQAITDSNGLNAYRTALGVDNYDYSSSQNGLSMLGELDLGINYRVSQTCRLNVGYRVLGITGLALAPAQIPSDFQWEPEINDINHNGDMILGGGYGGVEFCY